ncbi:MAG: response regulator [Oscillospiraceae bacterium]|jgi:CheY-like chemotaxis protein|nr:response regulator [Oscillospiraceae bacterium]
MGSTAYDIAKLAKISEFSMDAAIKNFISYGEYFEALDAFAEKARQYLRDYTPKVVTCSDETRRNFVDDVHALQREFVNLGMLISASALTDLISAAAKSDAESLEDGLRIFYADMELMAKLVVSARLQPPKPSSKEKPVVLAVDDKPEILTSVTGVLGSHYKVIAVTSGAAALEAARKYRPALFLLDIEMPEMNGLELAKALRELPEHKDTPLMFLTDNSARDNVLAAKALGVREYFLKPVNKELLRGKIDPYFGL